MCLLDITQHLTMMNSNEKRMAKRSHARKSFSQPDNTTSLFLSPSTLIVLMALILTSFVSLANSFNIDVPSVVTHRGPPNSMFGFSVAQHMDSNVSWLLVGAPSADTDQFNVTKGGAVFRCSCVAPNSCQEVPFDRQGNNVLERKQVDEKSNQWFGATVKSSGPDGIILACAPRYTWFSNNLKRKDPVGTCFIARDSFTEFVEYSPCRTARWGYHRQGSCQLGLGADVDPFGRRIFLGAVGSWYWQGQVFMIDSRKSTGDNNRVPFFQFLPPGQIYSKSSAISRPQILWTKEGPSSDDDSYLGYSVATGQFSDDNDADVVVGMPRGANLTGKIVIYSSDLQNLNNITGEQIGSYFGYSLCVMDIDGDGLHDIVVGAPMYTDFNDPSMKIETGRIYMLYQTRHRHFHSWQVIDGTANRGRFGLSLASLGDINKDGYEDFAVGAPYDGFYGEQSGAVYIYQGSATSVRSEPSQVIYGASFSQRISTFGFSLSGGLDLDNNGYPDLVVGAYDSDMVAYFRSRPVVKVKSKLAFESVSNKEINLDDKACSLRDGTNVVCLPMTCCMEYDGVGVDDQMDFNVQYTLDSQKGKNPRMFFLDQERRHTINETIRLGKKQKRCKTHKVYLRNQIRDKLTHLEAGIQYSMLESRYYNDRRVLKPVIDSTTSTAEKDSIYIQKDCGSDNICIPDLRLEVKSSSPSFVMGSTDRVWVDVDVSNNNENSYESTLKIKVPKGLSYVNYETLDANKDVPILCSPPAPSNNFTLKCDIGNPLPSYSKSRLKVYFQPSYTAELKSSYDIEVEVNSTNPEDVHTTFDNARLVSFPIKVATDLEVYGISDEPLVRHNISLYKQIEEKDTEYDIGPEITHKYGVRCLGPSRIEEAEVIILWPSYTLDGRHFVYLLEQPSIEGSATCEHVEDVNPLALTIQKKKYSYSDTIYGPSGITSSSSSGGTFTRNRSYTRYSEQGGRTRYPASGSSSYNSYQDLNGRVEDNDSSNYHNEHSERRFYSSSSQGGGYTRRYNYTKTYTSHGNYEGSTYPNEFQHYERRVRVKRDESKWLQEQSCGPTKCIKIRCQVKELAGNSSVFFTLRGRIWSDTLLEEFPGVPVNISSKLITRVTQLPYNVDPEYLKYKKFEIVTTVQEVSDVTLAAPIPWWIYLLAALAGLLLLLLIVYVLYKCGFFKRRRPRGPEGQPLHRSRD